MRSYVIIVLVKLTSITIWWCGVFSSEGPFNISLYLHLLIFCEAHLPSPWDGCALDVKQRLIHLGVIIRLVSYTSLGQVRTVYIWCNLFKLRRYLEASSKVNILNSGSRRRVRNCTIRNYWNITRRVLYLQSLLGVAHKRMMLQLWLMSWVLIKGTLGRRVVMISSLLLVNIITSGYRRCLECLLCIISFALIHQRGIFRVRGGQRSRMLCKTTICDLNFRGSLSIHWFFTINNCFLSRLSCHLLWWYNHLLITINILLFNNPLGLYL